MKKIAYIFLALAITSLLIAGCSTKKGVGQVCDEQSSGGDCKEGLLCGEGTPDNNFKWTCMTLQQCIDEGNTADAVKGSKFCFRAI